MFNLFYAGDRREGKRGFELEVLRGIRRIRRIARGEIVLVYFEIIF